MGRVIIIGHRFSSHKHWYWSRLYHNFLFSWCQHGTTLILHWGQEWCCMRLWKILMLWWSSIGWWRCSVTVLLPSFLRRVWLWDCIMLASMAVIGTWWRNNIVGKVWYSTRFMLIWNARCGRFDKLRFVMCRLRNRLAFTVKFASAMIPNGSENYTNNSNYSEYWSNDGTRWTTSSISWFWWEILRGGRFIKIAV